MSTNHSKKIKKSLKNLVIPRKLKTPYSAVKMIQKESKHLSKTIKSSFVNLFRKIGEHKEDVVNPNNNLNLNLNNSDSNNDDDVPESFDDDDRLFFNSDKAD